MKERYTANSIANPGDVELRYIQCKIINMGKHIYIKRGQDHCVQKKGIK